MNIAITIVGFLMIADSLFTLLNLDRVESFLHKVFPQLNVKKLAVVEGVVGCAVILIKLYTKTVV